MKTWGRLMIILQTLILSGVMVAGCGGDSSVTVVLRFGNAPPVADAGPDQLVTAGSLVTLDGSGSRDFDKDPLQFSWELVSQPAGSQATLSDPANVSPRFRADLEGDYLASLTVSDGSARSAPDSVTITAGPAAANILLFIGDGMGFEQVRAARLFSSGGQAPLSFEALPFQGRIKPVNAAGGIPDSAAAATALATGFMVADRVIAVELPGDGAPLTTILERFAALGRSTGLVTTTTITHATPAAFAAHQPDRGRQTEIALDYLHHSRPEVLLGGGQAISPTEARAAGYRLVFDRAGLQGIDPETPGRVWGLFGDDHLPFSGDGPGPLPQLTEMTRSALNLLESNPRGLFLMVEGGRIDHAGHANDLRRLVAETLEFARAVQIGMDWAAGRNDTLVLVTADHETGGLQVIQEIGQGELPVVSWTGPGHSVQPVPVYAWGVNAAQVKDATFHTDLHRIMMEAAFGVTAE